MLKDILIKKPGDVMPIITKYRNKKTEHFGIILLDSGHNVIKTKVLFIGGTCCTTVDKKVLFWELCKNEASAFIMFHNHPGGNPEPSSQDVETTENIKEAAKVLGLHCLDHVIIARHGYYSFLEYDRL